MPLKCPSSIAMLNLDPWFPIQPDLMAWVIWPIPINGDFSSSLFFHPSLIVILEKRNFSESFPFFVNPFLLSYLGPEGQFHRAHRMLQGGSSAASPSALWRPLEFLVEEVVQEELEVKDVEFEEDHMEVVRLVMNPYQLSGSGVNPCQVQGRRRYWSLWPSLRVGQGRGVRCDSVLVLELELLPPRLGCLLPVDSELVFFL